MRADLWVAEQLVVGQLDAPDFAALYLLEDGPQPPAEKVILAGQLLARQPGLPPAHLHLGREAVARGGNLVAAAPAAVALRMETALQAAR